MDFSGGYSNTNKEKITTNYKRNNRESDVLDFKQGQIWHKVVDEEHSKLLEDNPHLAKKDRFYLIISDDAVNAIMQTVVCIPITTQETKKYNTDVLYKDGLYTRAINTAQIQTFDKWAVNSRWCYKGTLSPEILEQVLSQVNKVIGYNAMVFDESKILKQIDIVLAKKQAEFLEWQSKELEKAKTLNSIMNKLDTLSNNVAEGFDFSNFKSYYNVASANDNNYNNISEQTEGNNVLYTGIIPDNKNEIENQKAQNGNTLDKDGGRLLEQPALNTGDKIIKETNLYNRLSGKHTVSNGGKSYENEETNKNQKMENGNATATSVTGNKKIKVMRKHNEKWTDDMKLQFLIDCNSGEYSSTELMHMYSFGSLKSLYSSKHAISKKINEA